MDYNKEAKELLLGKFCENCVYKHKWQTGVLTCKLRMRGKITCHPGDPAVIRNDYTCEDWEYAVISEINR